MTIVLLMPVNEWYVDSAGEFRAIPFLTVLAGLLPALMTILLSIGSLIAVGRTEPPRPLWPYALLTLTLITGVGSLLLLVSLANLTDTCAFHPCL
ncbi:MAG: hypothetical protein H0X24_04605 [Ktedonobacterales bacterium]|nr:hypothetical protein [Ktedonobacterales bacterium]